MQSIFREYDIRGIFEKELNEKTVKAIGFYLGGVVKAKCGKQNNEAFVAIGFDARVHSPTLFEWLSLGFLESGCNVLNMGMVTTGINYFTNFFEWEAGERKITPSASVMITGSHNPPEYNGFKITIDKAPFFGKDIEELGKNIIAANSEYTAVSKEAKIYTIYAKKAYIEYLVKEFSHLKGMSAKVAIDCGNGVAGLSIVDILSKLNINFKSIYENPDGTFPNHHPDPSEEHNLEDLKELMRKEGFELGFAFDGDADRIAVLTGRYNIKGDQLALIFARDMAKEGKRPTVIGEVKCSKVMYDEIDKIGTAIMYKTGHSNLKVKLRETKADFAAEVSGHMFFNDKWFGFDDAVYVAMRVLELIKHGVDLDKEMDAMPKLFSTDEIKVKVSEESKFKIIDKIKKALKNPPSYLPQITGIVDIDGVRVSFDDGWGLIRASNTTPVLVTRFEATSPETLETYKNSLNRLIEESRL